MASVRRDQGLSHAGQRPSWFTKDTDELNCKAGNTSGKRKVRKVKNIVRELWEQRIEKMSEINNPTDTNIREGGVVHAPGTRAEVPLQSMKKTKVKQVSLCSLWRGPCQSRHPHFSPWRTLRCSWWTCPEGRGILWKGLMLEQLSFFSPFNYFYTGNRWKQFCPCQVYFACDSKW